MKGVFIYFLIVLGFMSCSPSDKQITQTEFEHLFTHDSIESIHLNTSNNEAKIRIRSLDGKDISCVLPIESVEFFEKSFKMLRYKLEAQNIRPAYSMTVVSGGPIYAPIAGPLLFFCTLILFLIAVIDVLKNRFETATDKLIWFLVVFLIPFIGPILYAFIGRKQKLQKLL